ncbi:hypothetical protein, partial [Moorena sp. SIO3B2]|uniref:hypothetical protein n=1 Tax=Moorena sp. SIO3B2 TaxID=2607827 RepID=UPI00257A3531
MGRGKDRFFSKASLALLPSKPLGIPGRRYRLSLGVRAGRSPRSDSQSPRSQMLIMVALARESKSFELRGSQGWVGMVARSLVARSRE